MDQKKTGRLIAKKRKEMGLTLAQLSELLLVSPQAVSAWENGNRYPDSASQIIIEKAMGLNPVELITGVEMYDEKLKKDISYHMMQTDEKVFTGGIVTDEDGNEFYLDMSTYSIITTNEDGELSDKWIPYLEYHNAEPHVMTEREKEVKAKEDAIPKEEYNPMKVYINYGPAILIISKEILETVGMPKYFDICQNKDDGWVGLRFGDSGDFDIPDEVYSSNGLRINGGEFGADLCRQMGISRLMNHMVVTPVFSKKHNMLLLDLIEAKRVKVKIDLSSFVLPTWQYEEQLRIMEEEEAELEEAELEEAELEE